MEIQSICGGEAANQTEFIFKAGIVRGELCSWKSIRCGGTLITKTHVLTAAHCIANKNKEELKVIVGGVRQDGTDAVIYSIGKLKIHHDYKKFKIDYDIGVVVVSNFSLIKFF